jgi:hypothetical protein
VSSPKIQVQMPLSQPQNPPPSVEVAEALGLGEAEAGVEARGGELLVEAGAPEVGVALVVPPADVAGGGALGTLPAPADFWTLFAFATVPVGLAEGLAVLLVLPEGLAEGLALVAPGADWPEAQTVGNGRAGAVLSVAAMAGAAANAPAMIAAIALGTAMAVTRRRERAVEATDHSSSLLVPAGGSGPSGRAACSMMWVFSSYAASAPGCTAVGSSAPDGCAGSAGASAVSDSGAATAAAEPPSANCASPASRLRRCLRVSAV